MNDDDISLPQRLIHADQAPRPGFGTVCFRLTCSRVMIHDYVNVMLL
jgi:hypothetical protein